MPVDAEAIHCDWCGRRFADGERTRPGYDGEPSHVRCASFARQCQRVERDKAAGGVGIVERYPMSEREPFVNWPNGQGVYE